MTFHLHLRRTLGVYARLSVKQGHTATDITCGVDWPYPPDRPYPDPTDEIPDEPAGSEGVYRLKHPTDLKMTRAPDATAIRDGIKLSREVAECWIPHPTTNQPRLQATISLPRICTIADCYAGHDDAFARNTVDLIRRTLHPQSPSWRYGTLHHELHEYLRGTFGSPSRYAHLLPSR